MTTSQPTTRSSLPPAPPASSSGSPGPEKRPQRPDTLSPEGLDDLGPDWSEDQIEDEHPADLSPAASSSRAAEPSSGGENAVVLQLLDSILRDLDLLPDPAPAAEVAIEAPAPPTVAPLPAPTAPTRAPLPPARAAPPAKSTVEPHRPTSRASEPAATRGTPSPYLEERLTAALRAISEVREEMRDMALRSQAVRDTVGAVEVELERSMRELEFLRAQHGRAPLPAAPLPSRATRPAGPVTRASGDHGAGRYAEFTVDRYNRTMTQVKGRRRRMARWMVVLAALISTGLVAVDLAFPNPQPAWWLALLPAVWMIPVPFFALSFRGTQRVLKRNHFDLPGDA